jgi:SAM-dependent methyltransferase
MDKSSDNKSADPFDRLAGRYERYVPWKPRLAREIPFLDEELRAAGVRSVIDCACGPGRHAVSLAQKGFDVTGLDASPEMLERARSLAQKEKLELPFVDGKFESIPTALHSKFDGLLCLGNSLTAAEDEQALRTIIGQFAAALKSGGVAITQTVDFSVVAKETVTPTPLRHVDEDDREYLFVKSFVRAGERVLIHWVSMEQQNGEWSSEVTCREVFVVEPESLLNAFRTSGFSRISTFGDYKRQPFVKDSSRDLIIVARRA